jgi:hypothetical protein
MNMEDYFNMLQKAAARNAQERRATKQDSEASSNDTN